MTEEKPDLGAKIIELLDNLEGDDSDLSNLEIILGITSTASQLKNRPQIMLKIMQVISIISGEKEDFNIDDLDDLEPAINNLMGEPSCNEEQLIDLTATEK